MKLKSGVLLAAVVGLGVATAVVAFTGADRVLRAVGSIGWRGFGQFCLYSLILFPLLGAGWAALVPRREGGRFWTFVWGRQVRDAVSDVLPLSQLGGVVAGALATAARGVRTPVAYAASIVDLTTELAAQLAYTLYGVGFLIWLGLGSSESRSLVFAGTAGLVVAALCTAGFVVAQRQGARIVAWLAPRWFPSAVTGAEAVEQALEDLYGARGRVALSVALHVLGWFVSGSAAWLAAHLMGAPISLPAMLAIESLLYAVRSFAFFVPNAVGVQEGTYAVLGPLLGLTAEAAVAVSLLKRARDFTLGVPVLLIWQALEGRRLLAEGEKPEPAGASGG